MEFEMWKSYIGDVKTHSYIYIYIVIELHHDFLPLAICSGIRIFFVVSFVFISSEFRQTFRRVLCGKTFCHNILPQKKSSKFRPKLRWNFVKLELKQRNLWRSFNEIFTFIFCGKRCGKMDCHKNCPKSSTKSLTNSQRSADDIPGLLQIMSSTITRYT